MGHAVPMSAPAPGARRVSALGPLTVDGVPVPGARLERLARALLAAGGRVVGADVLVEAVWDGEEPADPHGALQALVSRLRRAGLGVTAVGPGYRAELDGVEVDLLRARGLLTAARAAAAAGEHAAAAERAREALTLWPGAPAADHPQAEPVLRGALLATLTEAELALGRTPSTLDELRALADAAPLDEATAALLLRALGAAGAEAEALERFERLREELAERFGTDPAPAVAAAHVALLRGELRPAAAPEPSTRPVPVGPPPRAARRPQPWHRRSTPLLGRDHDVDAVEAALLEAPLVTLAAVGGAGKTRLAYEVARRADSRGEPVAVLELAHVRTSDEVLPALLTLTGTGESELTGQDALTRRVLDVAERLDAAAGALDGLLVVDNCEHVLDAAADLVGGLLAAAGDRLRVVATSRAPLGLPGEVVHDVAALPDDVAVALLRERSQATRASTVWDDAVALELCHRLDNLPLAIELAAARTRSMPPAQVLAGVEHRFALLDRAVRGLPDRHQGLWAMVDWSWALLTPAQQDLLVRLAVVPAPFGADLAAALAGGGDVTLDLAALVEQSLVELADDAGAGTYRLLETVREYGEARLTDRGDRDATLDRLAAWAAATCRALAPDLVGPRQVATFEAVTRATDTLLAALRWAVDREDEAASYPVAQVLLTVWTSRGLHVEASRWAAAVLLADAPDRRRRSPVLAGASPSPGRALPHADEVGAVAVRALMNGAGAGAMRTAALGLRAARRVVAERRAELSPAGLAMAECLLEAGLASLDPEAWAATATARLLASGDPQLVGLALFLRAALAENGGDVSDGAGDALASYRSFETAGDQWGMGMSAQLVARVHSAAGEEEESLHWLTVAERHLRAIAALEDLTQVRVSRAAGRVAVGDREAEAELADLAGDPGLELVSRAQAGLALGAALAAAGRTAESLTWTDLALELAASETRPFPQSRVLFRVLAALVRLRAGIPAQDLLEATVPDALASRDAPVLGSLALGFAELAAVRGDRARADELVALAGRIGGNLSWFIGHTVADALLPTALAAGRPPRADVTSPEAIARILTLLAPGSRPSPQGWSAI